jgi:hypothetical protein
MVMAPKTTLTLLFGEPAMLAIFPIQIVKIKKKARTELSKLGCMGKDHLFHRWDAALNICARVPASENSMTP